MDTKYYKVTNLTTGAVVADRAKIAQDFKSRSIGLLNRSSLEEGEALVITPCNSIHTFFMKFPIDVIFLDKSAKVVKIKRALSPWRLSSCILKAYSVLELPKGKLEKTNIKIGDFIKIELTMLDNSLL